MRKLMRALGQLTGAAAPDKSAKTKADKTPAAPETPAAGTAPPAPPKGRAALIENALAIQRDSHAFDKLRPQDRARLQAIALRKFEAVLGQGGAKPPADGEATPGKPAAPGGSRPRRRK